MLRGAPRGGSSRPRIPALLSQQNVHVCMGVFTNVCKMWKKKMMGLLYV